MSVLDDLVKGVVDGALKEILKKTTGRSTLTKRRRRKARPATTLQKIERLLRPAKKQTSRKATTRARSKTKRRGF